MRLCGQVGAVKKLHANISVAAVGDMVRSQSRSRSRSQAACSEERHLAELALFFSSFGVFEESRGAESGSGSGSGGDEAGSDVIMSFYIQQCRHAHLSHSCSIPLPAAATVTPIAAAAAPSSLQCPSFQTSLLLFLQHVYARLLLVRSRAQQTQFHAHLRASLSTALDPDSDGASRAVPGFCAALWRGAHTVSHPPPSFASTGAAGQEEFLFHLLSEANVSLQQLEVPSGFQAKLMSAVLKCAPEECVLPALKRLLLHWIRCDDMTVATAGNGPGTDGKGSDGEAKSITRTVMPSLDLAKEIFKFVLSMKSWSFPKKAKVDDHDDDWQVDHDAVMAQRELEQELKQLQQAMASVLVLCMKHATPAVSSSAKPDTNQSATTSARTGSVNAGAGVGAGAGAVALTVATPVKILQVLQHLRLLDSVLDLSAFECYLVEAALGPAVATSIRSGEEGSSVVASTQDPLIPLAAYVKLSVSNSKLTTSNQSKGKVAGKDKVKGQVQSAGRGRGGGERDDTECCRRVCIRLARLLVQRGRGGRGRDAASGLLCRFQVRRTDQLIDCRTTL